MKQVTITTDKATILVVEVTDKREKLLGEGLLLRLKYAKDFSILGAYPSISEKQAKELVDSETRGKVTYYFNSVLNYHRELYAKEALGSLLRANGVKFTNPLGEEPDTRASAYTDMFTIAKNARRHGMWQEAQSKVWNKERTYLFMKV